MADGPAKVLIVDDHALVREGLQAVLGAHPRFAVVGAAETAEEALAICAREPPDVVVLDVRLPGTSGLAVLKELRRAHPATKVLMLSSHDGDEMIYQALAGGASGYVLKQSPSRALIEAIDVALQGGRAASGRVAERLTERLGSVPLSDREIEVLRRVAHGESNLEIGETLGISFNTVKTHVNNILAKLDATDRTEAVTIALQRGIITLDE